MTDEEIRQAAREICSLQAQKDANSDASDYYLNGNYDYTIWMRLVEQGIRKGIEQHEAYKQKVSDAIEEVIESCAVTSWGAAMLDPLITPKPKPDPLVVAYHDAVPETAAIHGKETVRHICGLINAALEARGFEIREKGQ